jgi:glycosyltransferase involved in cell wall biosynthesis
VYGRGKSTAPTNDLAPNISVKSTWGVDKKSTSTLTYGLSSSLHLARHATDVALVLNVANGFHLKRLSKAGIRTCLNVDGLEWMRAKWGRAARQVFLRGAELASQYADVLIFDSEALRDIWVQKFGRGGVFIPYGAEVLEKSTGSTLRDAGLPDSGYILVVSRIVPENNVDILLDAADHMDRRPEIIVVGTQNYQNSTVKRLTAMNREGKVRWIGHVSDQTLLNDLWARSGVYWHGHSVGGTNPALLQALGAGAPTLALDTVFNREVIRSPEQLVQPNSQDLASRLQDVLSDQELASRFRSNGQKLVQDRYTWSSVCSQYRDLMECLARGESSLEALTASNAASFNFK